MNEYPVIHVAMKKILRKMFLKRGNVRQAALLQAKKACKGNYFKHLVYPSNLLIILFFKINISDFGRNAWL